MLQGEQTCEWKPTSRIVMIFGKISEAVEEGKWYGFNGDNCQMSTLTMLPEGLCYEEK